MSQKRIREYDGKRLVMNWLACRDQSMASDGHGQPVAISPSTDLDQLPEEFPWLLEAKLVAKPDMLLKRRGKAGLLLLNADWPATKAWIEERRGKELEADGVKDHLTNLIVERFVPHEQSEEYYLCIQSKRDGDEIMFYHEGGVDVGDVDAKGKRELVEIDCSSADGSTPQMSQISRLLTEVPAERREALAQFVSLLFKCYTALHFAYLEINPLVFTGGRIHILDMAAKLDQAAHHTCFKVWGNIDFPTPFGKKPLPEEAYIAGLDEKTGASLKLTVLNERARIWTMVAGGGASVVYADTIADLGAGTELGNYGEYSGAPTEDLTFEYAKTIIQLMCKHPHKDGKILVIGGGIANFTNVAATFKGIIRALRENQQALQEHKASIYVRRGGPNYQEGLKLFRELDLGVPIEVHGPESHMTTIVAMALGKPIHPDNMPPVDAVGDGSPHAGSPLRGLHRADSAGSAGPPSKRRKVAMPRGGSNPPRDPTAEEKAPEFGAGIKRMATPTTRAIVYGMQLKAVQNMLDFDFVCRRPEPSVAAIVYEMASGFHYRQFYWKDRQIMIPVYQSLDVALEKFKEVDTIVNFASMRSAYSATREMMTKPQIKTIAIIAEGVPERHTRDLIQRSRMNGKLLIGPATVGGIKPGCFRIGNTGGMLDNILKSRLYRPGSVAYVSRSGGLSNELNNIISRHTDGVYEGVAIGGDRYPASTYMDHLLRYEQDPAVKLLVLLGEVGGTLEYDVIEAIKDGRIKKPLVVWTTGTCAKYFPYEVQFGHAGAMAQAQMETAHAKNEAFRAVGAKVPASFDDFGVLIKKTYKELVEKGTLVPVADVEPPQVPIDYHWAQKLGLIRKPAGFLSTITDERGSELIYAGMPISQVFEQEIGIGGVLGLLWFRRKLPESARKFIEIVLMITADHGPAVSGAHNTIVTARAGKDLISSLCSGLLTIGPRFGGALDDAAKTFAWAYDNGKTPEEFVQDMRKQRKLIPGIGHRVKSLENPDKRVELVVAFCKEKFDATPLLDYALKVQAVTTRKKSNLILNVDGAIACAFVDLLRSCGMFTREEADEAVAAGALNGLFVVGRSMGFVGHFLDQKRLKQGLYRHPTDDIAYMLNQDKPTGAL